MARIDFFEVKGSNWQASLCNLVERAVNAGERVYVLADSEAAARALDDLLWTFRDESFLPHRLWQGEEVVTEPVAVGWREGNPNRASCLAVAGREPPTKPGAFPRVLDVAPVDLPELRQAARVRYRALQEDGHEMFFHKTRS